MSRKRRPQQMSVEDAAESRRWRAQVLCEMLEGTQQPIQMTEPIKRMKMALEDYAASKNPVLIMECSACHGPCSERRNGLCNRCFDAQVSATPKLMFAEMQS